jgi:hypothetical protein
MVIGKDPEYVKVYADGQYGYTRDGKPVWNNFAEVLHVAPAEIRAIPGMPLIIGFDFGMHTAAVIGQPTFRGGMNILKEYYEADMGLRRFCQNILRPALFSNFRSFKIVSTCDPSGIRRQDTDERSCIIELKQQGFPVTPAPSNAWLPRFNAVDFYLQKLIEGKAGFQLDPSCRLLKRGFIKEYKLRKMQSILGGEKYSDLPNKNEFSHVQDCVQYICMIADKSITAAQGYDMMGERYTGPQPTLRMPGRQQQLPSAMPPDMSAWT